MNEPASEEERTDQVLPLPFGRVASRPLRLTRHHHHHLKKRLHSRLSLGFIFTQFLFFFFFLLNFKNSTAPRTFELFIDDNILRLGRPTSWFITTNVHTHTHVLHSKAISD